MNPYDFVRIDWKNPPERHSPIYHEKFNGLSGEISGKIIAETPIFIPQKDTDNPKLFIQNKNQEYIIPGSSLKGLFRNLAETLGNGCFLLLDSHKIPDKFKKCSNPKKLCIACRMFGTIQGSDVFKGKVFFNDAIATLINQHESVYTVDLMTPNPRHETFYIGDDGNIAGRKFYFHHANLKQSALLKRHDTRYNQHIKPLGAGTEFEFSVEFVNLEEIELKTLLYVLVLEPEMRHKVGYAKPNGLGSVKINLTKIKLIDYVSRYTQKNNGITEYQGVELQNGVGMKMTRRNINILLNNGLRKIQQLLLVRHHNCILRRK